MKEPVYVGISEAAVLLGVSPDTVTRWANNKKLNVVYTVGGQRRIPMAEIERLLTSTDEDRAERTKLQTRAAREALARKRSAAQTQE